MGRALFVLQLGLVVWFAATCTCEPEPLAGPDAAKAYAERHGIPLSFTEKGGRRFVLVAPGEFVRRPEGGAPHTVRMRLPYYLQAEPGALGSSYTDALALAERVTRRNGDHLYRLATEAEWEHAVASGSEAIRPDTATWCADWFAPHLDQDLSNPLGPREGADRVIRSTRAPRYGLKPSVRKSDVGVQLVAEIGWAGNRPVTLRTVVRDLAGNVVGEKPGYRLKLIRILDRLADRQAGRQEEWTPLEGTSPLTLRMFPGRYYVVAVEDDPRGFPDEGPEAKILVKSGPHVFDIEVPGSRAQPDDD